MTQSIAEYDYRGLSRALMSKRLTDTRGIRAISGDIGVTVSDLSRAMGGQPVSVAKVIALCQWLGEPVERFYMPPENQAKSTCFSGRNVKHPVSQGQVRS